MLLFSAVHAQEKAIVTPFQTGGFKLGTAPFTLRVPVLLKEKKDVGELRLEIVDVSRDQQRDAQYMSAFSKPKLRFADDGAIPFIETTVDPDKLSAPGTYTLGIAISAADGQQILSVQLTRAPAKINPPPTLGIVQERFPFFASAQQGQPLVVEAQDAGSPVSDLKIIQQEFANSSGETSGAQLEFEQVEKPLVSGGPVKVGYRLVGDFPLGKNTGKIRLSSSQLADPLIVNFEVLARRSRLFIPLVLLLGLLAGYYSRNYLKKIIDQRQALRKVFDLREKLGKSAQHPDADYQREARTALDSLETITKKTPVDELDKLLSEASESLRAAAESLENRKAAALAEYDRLVKFGKLKPLLPPSFAEPLEEFETRLAVAKESLDKEAITDFQTVIDDAGGELFTKLKAEMREYARQQKELLDALEDPAAFSAPVAEKIAAVDNEIRTKIESAEKPLEAAETPASADLKLGLQKIYEIREAVRDLLNRLPDWLRLVYDEAINTLRIGGISDEAAVTALNSRVNKLSNLLKSGAAESPETDNRLAEIKPNLAFAWRDAIKNQARAGLEKTAAAQIDELLKENEYVKAAALVAELNKLAPAVRTRKYLGETEENAETGLTRGSKSIMLPDFQTTKNILFGWTDFLVARPTAAPDAAPIVNRQQIDAELGTAKLLQTLIIGAGIMLTGYLIFADSFIGTGKELAMVFFWAFTLDVTLDNLVDKAAGLKK